MAIGKGRVALTHDAELEDVTAEFYFYSGVLLLCCFGRFEANKWARKHSSFTKMKPNRDRLPCLRGSKQAAIQCG